MFKKSIKIYVKTILTLTVQSKSQISHTHQRFPCDRPYANRILWLAFRAGWIWICFGSFVIVCSQMQFLRFRFDQFCTVCFARFGRLKIRFDRFLRFASNGPRLGPRRSIRALQPLCKMRSVRFVCFVRFVSSVRFRSVRFPVVRFWRFQFGWRSSSFGEGMEFSTRRIWMEKTSQRLRVETASRHASPVLAKCRKSLIWQFIGFPGPNHAWPIKDNAIAMPIYC